MDMIEKVCRAIAADVAQCPIAPTVPCDSFASIARAAIEAMREPTDAMIKPEIRPGAGVYGDIEAAAIWRRMIDAALKKPVDS